MFVSVAVPQNMLLRLDAHRCIFSEVSRERLAQSQPTRFSGSQNVEAFSEFYFDSVLKNLE